mgnify:CR=1 FL=1
MARGAKRSIWTEERVQWLREHSYNRWKWEIQEDFCKTFGIKCSISGIGSALKRFNISTDVKSNRWRELPNCYQRATTPEQDKIVFEHFHQKGFGSYVLLQKFFKEQFGLDFSLQQCKGYCGRKRLVFGVDTRFKKGNEPGNKGMKLTDAQKAKSARGWFKKGHKPSNWKPVGTVSMRGGFLMIKTEEPNHWRMLSRVTWERETGEKLKKTEMIIFLDGNVRNLELSNLCKVDRSINSIMNNRKFRSDLPEITKAYISVAQLMLKSNQVKKQ